MAPTSADLAAFATEVRRLAGRGEPPLYPAFQALLEAVYGSPYTVDTLLRMPGAGFPDFTVSLGLRLMNWVEVKHPGVSVDPLPGPDQERFDRYRAALPHIVLTNGWCWRLFRAGQEIDRCDLPKEWLTGAQALSPAELAEVERFFTVIAALTPSAATSYDEAVRLLATSARLVEQAVLDAEGALPASLLEAQGSFNELLQTNPADPSTIRYSDFADQLAQVCVFGYLMARVEAGRDVTPFTAHSALTAVQHPFLRATLYAMVAPDPDLEDVLSGVLRTACDAVNAAAPVLAGPKGDWQHVPYVYEPFFSLFKPADRFRFGVFYTPEPITRFQAREVQEKLRSEFGLTGLTDPAVRFMDPACGTGTYLLALAEEALEEATTAGAPAASTLKALFEQRVVAFEVSPGPAAVAQARMTAWLRGHGVTLTTRLPIYTANTLTPPAIGTAASSAAPANVWMTNVSQEQTATDAVKTAQPVLVVIGNPPWGDRPRETFRVGPQNDQNIIAAWAEGADGAVIHLYDLYVAFWRFACGMLLERPGVQPPQGIVSYITNRSWLRGKAYSGMRRWLRAHDVTATVTDLGGDSRAGATRDDDPVFAIRAGSAVATLVFKPGTTSSVQARRVRGSRAEKLAAMTSHTLPPLQSVIGKGGDPFGAIDWGSLSHGLPITSFLRGHYPGVKTHRDELVVNVDKGALLTGLHDWNDKPPEERKTAFKETRDRTAPDNHTVDPVSVIAHRYRPLDDRFLYKRNDFIDQPGRVSRVYEQAPGTVSLLTMDTRTTVGPVVIATNTLPGYNSFRGSYETHSFPVVGLAPQAPLPGFASAATLPDALTTEARSWANEHGASTEDVACYMLALGNAPSFQQAHAEALESDIVRFPAVTDKQVFADGVTIGKRLLAAWKLEAPPRGKWTQASTGTQLGHAVVASDHVLFENDDHVDGLRKGTGEFQVSAYRVLERYLQARAHLELSAELGASITKLTGAIAVILDEQDNCDELLSRAIAAPAVSW